MYNRYIPGAGGYTRVVEEEPPVQRADGSRTRRNDHRQPDHTMPGGGRWGKGAVQNLTAPLRFLAGEDKNAGIAGILKSFHFEDLDSGDVLLLLIILLLFLEGDNIELVITLGLMLLLGSGDTQNE